MSKPFIGAADNNKEAILAGLAAPLADCRRVLEIGSGTGQHAVHFAAALDHLVWQTSDRSAQLAGIRLWLEEAGYDNLPPPLALDVTAAQWPATLYDAVYSANTVHYMAWAAVEALYAGVHRVLRAGGLFALYGPFNYDGRYISEGNRRLDAWLRSEDPDFAIRDLAELVTLGERYCLTLRDDLPMPANNRLLLWQHGAAA